MSDLVKEKWFQVLYVLMSVPGLWNNLQRRVIFTAFSTDPERPLYGRVRIYLINSLEQVLQVHAQNRDYIWLTDFSPYVEEVVNKDRFPRHNCEGLPEVEMHEDTELGAWALGMVEFQMEQQRKTEREAEEALRKVEQSRKKAKA
ncbi:MAG: hypothetical protein HYT15_00720 [Candidatus Magasanikbacteria bacterium]|nr:hypothetical protein [Candidatus Magasanikbacteria bacterium]